MTNVVFATYTATREQRTDLLRHAVYLLNQNGYTPQQVDSSDERLTLVDALMCSARRWLNYTVAWNDAMFLVNARLASQGVRLDGGASFSDWLWAQSWETITAWLESLADVVWVGMA